MGLLRAAVLFRLLNEPCKHALAAVIHVRIHRSIALSILAAPPISAVHRAQCHWCRILRSNVRAPAAPREVDLNHEHFGSAGAIIIASADGRCPEFSRCLNFDPWWSLRGIEISPIAFGARTKICAADSRAAVPEFTRLLSSAFIARPTALLFASFLDPPVITPISLASSESSMSLQLHGRPRQESCPAGLESSTSMPRKMMVSLMGVTSCSAHDIKFVRSSGVSCRLVGLRGAPRASHRSPLVPL